MNFKNWFAINENQLWQESNELILPELFQKLKETKHPLAGVHFSQQPQLTFNPQPSHHDPIGIYAFPKDYVLNGKLQKNQGFANYPFAFILQPSTQAKILNLDMDINQAESLLTQIGIDKELLHDEKIYHRSSKNSPGHRFWGTLEYIRNSQQLSKNVSWNSLFNKTGYNAIYDPDKGIIHYNEPEQIIYLKHNAYNVIDVIKNSNPYSLMLLFAQYFPNFKIYKLKSTWTKEEFLIKLKHDNVTINLHTNKFNPNRLHVNLYGFGDKYSSKEWYQDINNQEELEQLTNQIKQYMQTTEKTKSEQPTNHPLIQQLAHSFKLKFNPDFPYELSKTYKNKTKFKLTHSPSTNTIHLSISSYPIGLGRYHYYSDDLNLTNPHNTLQNLINNLEDKIQQDRQDYKAYYHYDAPYALKFLNYLKHKVFIKRNAPK